MLRHKQQIQAIHPVLEVPPLVLHRVAHKETLVPLIKAAPIPEADRARLIRDPPRVAVGSRVLLREDRVPAHIIRIQDPVVEPLVVRMLEPERVQAPTGVVPCGMVAAVVEQAPVEAVLCGMVVPVAALEQAAAHVVVAEAVPCGMVAAAQVPAAALEQVLVQVQVAAPVVAAVPRVVAVVAVDPAAEVVPETATALRKYYKS